MFSSLKEFCYGHVAEISGVPPLRQERSQPLWSMWATVWKSNTRAPSTVLYQEEGEWMLSSQPKVANVSKTGVLWWGPRLWQGNLEDRDKQCAGFDALDLVVNTQHLKAKKAEKVTVSFWRPSDVSPQRLLKKSDSWQQ